jgi:hypothetical protein
VLAETIDVEERESHTSLARVDAASDLAVIDAFRAAIDATDDPSRLKDAIGYASAVGYALRLRGASRSSQEAWGDVKHRAERKIGAMLSSVELDKGGRPSKKTRNTRLSVRLADLDITPMQSSRWQTMARLTEAEYEAYCARMKARDEEITSNGIYEQAKLLHPRNAQQANPPLPSAGDPANAGGEFPEVDTTIPVVEHACPNCGHVFGCDGGVL